MIYRELINGHIWVNHTHYIVSCPKCRAGLAEIAGVEVDKENDASQTT